MMTKQTCQNSMKAKKILFNGYLDYFLKASNRLEDSQLRRSKSNII
jgi:hypothetical protein